jgi:sirohydrochlorin cobaltochelatase
MMSQAIVLFAHGSRDPHWHEPIAAVARAIAERSPQTPVRCAYLELSEPSLPQAVEALVAQGVDAVRVFPLFLGMGKHAREDLPQLMQGLRQAHLPHLIMRLRHNRQQRVTLTLQDKLLRLIG